MEDLKTLSDVLMEYQNMLIEYRAFMTELEKRFGPRTELNQLPGGDAAKRQEWEAKLKGAERILGPGHVRRVLLEVGVKSLSTKP